MYIISKIKDYYDCIMATGVDRSVVYKRKEDEIGFEIDNKSIAKREEINRYDSFSSELKNLISKKTNFKICEYSREEVYLSKYDEKIEFYVGILMFCGKVYPYIKSSSPYLSRLIGFKTIYAYSVEELESELKKITEQKYIDSFFNKSVYKYSNMRNKIETFFDELSKIDCTNIHNELDSPIIDLIEKRITKNPLLSEMFFMKIKDPYMAYMEISSFISGVMGGNTPRMIEIADVVRLEAHGFDKKISFRKRKE